MWALIPYDWCPIRRGHTEMCPKGRRPCDKGGRDGSDGSISQGTPSITGSHQNLEEAKKVAGLADTLILGFWPPDL